MELTRTLAAVVVGLIAITATAQEGEIYWKPTEVAPGLFMLEGQGG